MYQSMLVCFFKHKTAYGRRISGCSSDVCSSALLHGRSVPKDVRADATADERWTRPRCGSGVATDKVFQRVAAKVIAAHGREERSIRCAASLLQPSFQQRCRLAPQRRTSLLPTLAVAPDEIGRAHV